MIVWNVDFLQLCFVSVWTIRSFYRKRWMPVNSKSARILNCIQLLHKIFSHSFGNNSITNAYVSMYS